MEMRDGDAATRKKETDSERQRRRKDAVYVKEGCIEHIMSHTRIKIGVGAVLDERGKGDVVKWMKEVRKLREIHRRGIERVRECERD